MLVGENGTRGFRKEAKEDGSGMRGGNGRRKEKEGEKREEGRIEEVKRRKEGMVEEKRRKLMQDGSDMAFCGGSATSIDGYGTAGEAGGVPGPAPLPVHAQRARLTSLHFCTEIG